MALFKKSAKKRAPSQLQALQLFNESDYVEFHKDVSEAIQRNEIKSGFHHYRSHGIFEGRFPGFDGFSAEEYLKINPDLAERLTTTNKEAAAKFHFSNNGFKEGRRWREDLP